MAAHSGGVDWSSVIKPLLNTGILQKNDFTNIVKTIIKSEKEILEHDEIYEPFYKSFVQLAADAIAGHSSSICQTQLPSATEACNVLIRFMLNRITNSSNVDTKQYLYPIKGLCVGKSQIGNFELTAIQALLKNAKQPEHSKTNVTGSEKDSPKTELNRSRSDLSSVILQQLTTPLGSGKITWAPLSNESSDCTAMFYNVNINTLQANNAGDIILDVCCALPILSRYRQKYEESALQGKPLYLPINNSEATIIKNTLVQMSSDISILSLALSLPIIEPLTPNKITQLSKCALSALNCAVLASIALSVLSMSSSGTKSSSSQLQQQQQQQPPGYSQTQKDTGVGNEETTEDYARTVVDKALAIFSTVGSIFKESTRSHIYQNHLSMGSWILISGIQGAMGLPGSGSTISSNSSTTLKTHQSIVDDGKGKSPAKNFDGPASANVPQQQQIPTTRGNFLKFQQGFGVLNAAIACHCLTILTELIEDLRIETRTGDDIGNTVPEPAGFNILGHYTALQRVVRVLNCAQLQQLLTLLATISYRKACTLKRANKNPNDGEQISYSDSTTYFNDTFSCSEDSETEEEDSESYLGLWFKETLSPEANDDTNENEKNLDQKGNTLVPVKDEPHEYLELSAEIFTFLDNTLGSEQQYLNRYIRTGLSEQQMVLLANILKDLDRDAARGEQENFGCAQWQTAMVKFSGSLGRYLHNLISGNLLNETLQSSLLQHLGVSPWTQESNIWPLQVYSRTLAVLVQILLLKPSQEKEAACLSVWHRLVNTLVEGVCSPQNQQTTDMDTEDLNVEHAQLLLFLFHSLNLMQKKSILLLTAGGVIRCAEVCRVVTPPEKPLKDNQIMLLSRLLLFLEYLMKHLYNAPPVLLEQVRWNLFSVITLDSNQKLSDILNNKMKMMSFCRKDIEDKHKKMPTEIGTVRPKFYSLTLIDTKVQQEFKLDGLGWNFILCTPDKLKYPLLVDALIDILSIIDANVPYNAYCAVHYCFSLCWKLLLGLPPSTQHVESLMQEKTSNLHSLAWSIRCMNPSSHSHYLIVNSLVKQGMYTQFAENLWSKLIEYVADEKYSLSHTVDVLEVFNKTFAPQSPKLSKIMLLDSIVSHLYAIKCIETDGNGAAGKSKQGGNGTSSTQSSINDQNIDAQITSPITPTTSSTSAVIVPSTTAIITQTTVSTDDLKQAESVHTKEELIRNLMSKLIDAAEIVRDTAFKLMLKIMEGPIPSVLMESLISMGGNQCKFSTELSNQIMSLITGQDKDVITGEWNKQLVIATDENFTSPSHIEVHTINVIEAHLAEISKNSSYPCLLSLKHTLKSMVNLMYYLLPDITQTREGSIGSVSTDDETTKILDRLRQFILPLIFDVRTEYIYPIANKVFDKLISGNYALHAYSYLMRHSYKFLCDYAELSAAGRALNVDEIILHQLLKFWETMLDKSKGTKAIREFFYETKQGSLVTVLLSFSGTTLSQSYSTKVLQFFEKLFQQAERSDTDFPLHEVCSAITELGNVEPGKLKNWLSHILLGPHGVNPSSNNSSNVQTPTNMATASGIASISDQAFQTSEMILDVDAMDIEDFNAEGQLAGITSGGGGGVANATSSARPPPISSTTNRSDGEINNGDCLEKNGRLLQSLTKYIVSERQISPNVSNALFQALIQLGHNLLIPTQDALDFTDLLQVMVTLADFGNGKGHAALFTAAIDWLDISKNQVLEKYSGKALNTSKATIALENVSSILKYMCDLLQGLGSMGNRVFSPPWEDDFPPDSDDIFDDLNPEEDDSAVEDSDEDSLGNKLCTFSVTQKEFTNQHWYHCHTCKMVDGVGVCSICARVCHKNHDISYAKYGNFFCDCGSKEDGSCQALTRRTNSNAHELGGGATSSIGGGSSSALIDSGDHTIQSSLRRRTSSPNQMGHHRGGDITSSSMRSRQMQLAKVIDASKDMLKNNDNWRLVIKCLFNFFNSLMPAIEENCGKYSTVGCHMRARNALEKLHTPEKSYTVSDQIMVATLGSQEGAFENVRMTYSGEQGQTIRQLLSTNLVRRVGMCCLASPHGKRQHMAVSHEKGKVTILQLSTLLKQADASKRKLTLTRLTSAPIPCTVLSLASNPANEDFLAVCGLRECHILTFSSNGAANEHIVLTPQLEIGNFIKRAIWLPGSQTKLALVTADFVKIYELAEDTLSPQYYFLLPSGKIRDCAFVYQEETYYMLLMASSGYIYTQPLADESLAQHGPFYVTNTLELDHPLIKDVNGQIGDGGISLYYSHVLQMLFFSNAQGRSFMAPLTDVNAGVKCVMHLQNGTTGSKNSLKGPPQPLCQWSEIVGHPGIVLAMMQNSNNPVIFMLKPDGVVMQEIKPQNPKAKIIDMVGIRHSVSGTEKTTLILLCEDGSLRIYAAHQDHTGFWLSPEVQPSGNLFYPSLMPTRSRKHKKNMSKNLQMSSTNGGVGSGSGTLGISKGSIGAIGGTSANPIFPIDFFEHCSLMNDVEFGGNDLLQIYNTQQLKHRLNSTGLYVVSTKANGFILDITNNDTNMVITGIRILIGTQDAMRAPQNCTIYGRTLNTLAPRPRWFDIPLTRDESLKTDKKISITFGLSQDPDSICMLDSIKVYGKTKDVFGWPEESDEGTAAAAANGTTAANNTQNNGQSNVTGGAGSGCGINGFDNDNPQMANITPLDKMVSSMLEVLDSGLNILGGSNVEDSLRTSAIDISTKLLLYPTPNCVQNHAKCVLATLHGTKAAYHAYKDNKILFDVNNELEKFDNIADPRNIDPEAFYRLILMIRSVAVARPQTLSKICIDNQYLIFPLVFKLLKKLHKITPSFEEPCSIIKRGLSHTEIIIHSIVEIIYAFALSDPMLIDTMSKYFVELLLDPSVVISNITKLAMIRLLKPKMRRRRVLIGSPPACSTPTPTSTPAAIVAAGPSTSAAAVGSGVVDVNRQNDVANDDFNVAGGIQEVDQIEPLGLEGAAAGNPQALASLEALLGVGGLLDLQQDVDDEAIMEIAIALSLSENEGDIQVLEQGLANLQGRALQGLQALAGVAAAAGGSGGGNVGGVVGGYSNDATASAGGSDDEGSNAATDGSTLRTSPAEHAGSGGSESGGSGVESIGGASGRSSTYGDQPNQSPPRISGELPTQSSNVPELSSSEEQPVEEVTVSENYQKLHQLRYTILDKMIDNFNALDTVATGTQSISFMQVILMLTTDLDGSQENDQKVMQKLLATLIEKLELKPSSGAANLTERTPKSEVQLVILYFVGVLMGKVKSSKSSSTSATVATTSSSATSDNTTYVATATANALFKNGIIPFCFVFLDAFLNYWKNVAATEDSNKSSSTASASININKLLKPTKYGSTFDMQPFFNRQNIESNADIFDFYPQIITEMAVRLPYQVFRLSLSHPSSSWDWYDSMIQSSDFLTYTLCEYMMYIQSTILRRQIRKLLLYICGSKDKYRQYRDNHSLETHMKAVKKCCDETLALISSTGPAGSNSGLSYDTLVDLTEHLKTCQEIAQVRTGNWQRFCISKPDMLSTLLRISCFQLDEGVCTIILQLLQYAICNVNGTGNKSESGSGSAPTKPAALKERRDRDKSEESDCTADSKFDPTHCSVLVAQLFGQVPQHTLTKFIKNFLLETNSTTIRWQAHGLIYAMYENTSDTSRQKLLQVLWDLWALLPAYGRRTAQFVDLLGFLTLTTKSITDKLFDYTAQAVSVLRQQNELLSRHPNAPIYTSLGQVLEVDGFYLESEPCLVCNNPEVPMSNIKLSSIRIDSKFTTTTIIVKLIQSHTISKILLRIAELKRTKMVKTLNIYYNNRTVQAVVELKNRPNMWHKARKVTLPSGQTEVKIDFPLPITACNLMIEYADFYETVTGSSESLQCPRCSTSVPANPGVCGHCGENVFQCHKCRAINYDEKDPFLCHSCGFCKYAKFDYSIYGRPCCAVDPIESADDRAKTVQTIHTSLEKADRAYRHLEANKQFLEILIQKVSEHKLDRNLDESLVGTVGTSQVNKVIQLLAQKYCVESKSSFEELSKIIQKVQACRRELVAYDRSQMDVQPSQTDNDQIVAVNKCYGCALASTEQCLTLLRAMASNLPCRIGLCEQGLVHELAQNNLRRGTIQIQDEVRHLLCLLIRDLPEPTKNLCSLIQERVKMALSGSVPMSNLDSAIRHEMALLESMVAQDDSCWEVKLRIVLDLFLAACKDCRGPAIPVIQPCLRIIQSMICPPLPTSKANNKDSTTGDFSTVQPLPGMTVNYQKWLDLDQKHSFSAWKSRMWPISQTKSEDLKTPENKVKPPATQNAPNINNEKRSFRVVMEQKRLQFHNVYLMEKYARRWRSKILRKNVQHPPLDLFSSWLQMIVFNPNSRIARQLACALITSLSRSYERKREVINLLTSFLKCIGDAGEASSEFLTLYRSLADDTPWRQYLALKGVLTLIAELLTVEIEKIHRLEETTLSSDLAQGYALRQLVELMAMFLENPMIRQTYKGRLLGPVLQGYLSLRKLVVQRTRQVDDAQERLLEMLEEMTTGTEEETRAFMAVLIDTVQKTPLNDIKTPVFIFERLCSIIHPEENDVGEFFLTLEKDPQQEDFLQGRMLGNPYPSTEAGLGPLMRDVKNKICMDCELVALLEDDNGMELLVHNKIISLDLPVKEVYKKIWLAEGGERDAMRVVYRMRGLLGDATEEFVETLNAKSKEEIDNEQLYRMANVLADCEGLKVMLDRIGSLSNISRTRTLIQVLLKLFLLSVKVRRCQDVLCQPELGAINILLKVLQLCLQTENDTQQQAVTEQLLEIMETILSKAASDTLDSFLQFSLTFGGPEYVQALISCTNCNNVRNSASVLRHLIRVLAALVYGNDIKMALLCEHFKVTLDFNKFDAYRTAEDEFKMELFCILTNQIEHNSIGGTLKDYIISLGIVDRALDYILSNAPCVKPTLLRTDSDELKEFISKPSLKYILRFLTGLATKHEPTQIAVSRNIIPIIHRLEQVSSDEHVGSLAENLLEALCTDPVTSTRVQEVRDFTRAEKKRLAMATREKQLDALGMRTNEKGQVTAKGSILQKIEKLRDETGLVCFICREGYACQPTKVLGIYTYTKRTNVEEYELKPRKTVGYTTVSHFNVVHIDCHMSAIRLARGRDEWESASLQNANTRCNGLLPLWGPEVPEQGFTNYMSRHNAYMQESTQRCEITFSSAIHDLKLLLWRFAQEKSFHEDAGGGGPQSNMHIVPYLLFYALYNQYSSRTPAEKSLTTYLNIPRSERWLESAYDVEGPVYQITLSLALHSLELWNHNKLIHLQRLLTIAHARHCSPTALCKALNESEKQPKDYAIYKPYLMMWALIDLLYTKFFKAVPKDDDWPKSLFVYIRGNDEAMMKSSSDILATLSEEFMPCTSFAEFCDVAGLLNLVEDPDGLIKELLESFPTATSSTA